MLSKRAVCGSRMEESFGSQQQNLSCRTTGLYYVAAEAGFGCCREENLGSLQIELANKKTMRLAQLRQFARAVSWAQANCWCCCILPRGCRQCQQLNLSDIGLFNPWAGQSLADSPPFRWHLLVLSDSIYVGVML